MSSVLLPQPLGPTMLQKQDSATAHSTPSSASRSVPARSKYVLETPFSSTKQGDAEREGAEMAETAFMLVPPTRGRAPSAGAAAGAPAPPGARWRRRAPR